MISSVKNLN